jgi:hypothetical protein
MAACRHQKGSTLEQYRTSAGLITRLMRYRATKTKLTTRLLGWSYGATDGRFAAKYVVEDVDRHGNVRVYFRRPGFAKFRLRGLPGSDQFQFAYAAALANTEIGAAPGKLSETDPKSLAWLANTITPSSNRLSGEEPPI